MSVKSVLSNKLANLGRVGTMQSQPKVKTDNSMGFKIMIKGIDSDSKVLAMMLFSIEEGDDIDIEVSKGQPSLGGLKGLSGLVTFLRLDNMEETPIRVATVDEVTKEKITLVVNGEKTTYPTIGVPGAMVIFENDLLTIYKTI
jgi:hypothetical protein